MQFQLPLYISVSGFLIVLNMRVIFVACLPMHFAIICTVLTEHVFFLKQLHININFLFNIDLLIVVVLVYSCMQYGCCCHIFPCVSHCFESPTWLIS